MKTELKPAIVWTVLGVVVVAIIAFVFLRNQGGFQAKTETVDFVGEKAKQGQTMIYQPPAGAPVPGAVGGPKTGAPTPGLPNGIPGTPGGGAYSPPAGAAGSGAR